MSRKEGGAAGAHFKVPKNLSGGERSFSTVSLLLSLWDTASSPLRCLDEWDVFLDAGNRGVAARMLVRDLIDSLTPCNGHTDETLVGRRRSGIRGQAVHPHYASRELASSVHWVSSRLKDLHGVRCEGPGNKQIRLDDPVRNQ